MTARWLLRAAALVIVASLSARSVLAQGDGPRAHWKGMLTETNIFSLTSIRASGNTNPLDPAHTVLPGSSFDVDLALVGFSRSFSLFDRTALGTILLPVGEVSGEVDDPAPLASSARGFGDPLLQLDVNLIGAPAMKNMPALLRYEPDFTMDFVASLAIPIGEYDENSAANVGQNRWYGRIGAPIMFSLDDWVPGSRRTLEFMPAVWLFEENSDFLGQTVDNDPLLQLDAHLTQDFTTTFWGSLDAVWYYGGEATIAGQPGVELNDVGAGFSFGYQLNDNLMLTAGYTATIGEGSEDLDLGAFRINLIYGWHKLIEGLGRLE